MSGAIGANGSNQLAPMVAGGPNRYWRKFGSIIMDPMEPLDGDAFFMNTTQSVWIIWNSNGDNVDNKYNGDNVDNKYL